MWRKMRATTSAEEDGFKWWRWVREYLNKPTKKKIRWKGSPPRNKYNSLVFPLCAETYEPLLIYTHYIITIFSLSLLSYFAFVFLSPFGCSCCRPVGCWLQLNTHVRRRCLHFMLAHQSGPFHLSFSFILFHSFFFARFFGCHIYLKLRSDQRKQKCRARENKKQKKYAKPI